jgi:hypothetical protein
MTPDAYHEAEKAEKAEKDGAGGNEEAQKATVLVSS